MTSRLKAPFEFGYILIFPDSPTQTTGASPFSFYFLFSKFPANKADFVEGSSSSARPLHQHSGLLREARVVQTWAKSL